MFKVIFKYQYFIEYSSAFCKTYEAYYLMVVLQNASLQNKKNCDIFSSYLSNLLAIMLPKNRKIIQNEELDCIYYFCRFIKL